MATTLVEVLDHVSRNVTASAPHEDLTVLATYREIFDNLPHPPSSNINIFTFFTSVPETHRKISYVDVTHDHHLFDYARLIAHFLDATLRLNPKSCVFLVTGEHDALELRLDPRVVIVRLPLDPKLLMLERVRAMTAYSMSGQFCRNTLFLDTDAFPNAPLATIFDGDFDIGVTWRPSENFYMPLNEGVILAGCARPQRIVEFFARYHATYVAMTNDPVVSQYYGDICRWRGGQLCLNAVVNHYAQNVAPPSIAIRQFDCETHNFWVRPDMAFTPEVWDEKTILHLKGDSKSNPYSFLAYHQHRLERWERVDLDAQA